MASSLKQTMDDARKAMSAFAENMEALKRNFIFRGFYNERGYYFNLADISPAAYRQGALTRDGSRRSVHVWLTTAVLLEPAPDEAATERLTDDGKARLDSAIGGYPRSTDDRGADGRGRGLRAARDPERSVSALARTSIAGARLPDQQVLAHAADIPASCRSDVNRPAAPTATGGTASLWRSSKRINAVKERGK